jgi:DNA polymerase-1
VRQWLEGNGGDLTGWPKTKSGLLSTERDHLVRLVLRNISTVRPLLTILALETLLRTFGPKLAERVNPLTGRIHADYVVSGSKAGRFTSSGPNLQQLPAIRAPDFRRVIVAAPRHLLVCGDYSQIELRAAAWIYDDPELTKIYVEGHDLHAETAAFIAGVLIEAVTPEQRSAAKAVNFGSIYGISAEGLAVQAFADYGIDMSVAEAQAALDRFFDKFRVLKQGRWRHWDRVKAENLVRIGAGRTVRGEWEAEKRIRFTQSCNLRVQGAAADAMLRAMIQVHRRMPGAMVCTVHDELLLEVPESGAEDAARVLEEVMVEAFCATFPKAPTFGLVEVHVGRDWKEAKG